MKQELEKLLIFLIPALIIEKLFYSISKSLYKIATDGISEINSRYSIGELMHFGNWFEFVGEFLPVIVIAVWIWKIEKSINGRPYLWSLGSILLNYWILLLFIGQRVYGNNIVGKNPNN